MKEAALKLLSYRPYPVRKLTDKLREKGYGLDEIGVAIEDLERLVGILMVVSLFDMRWCRKE